MDYIALFNELTKIIKIAGGDSCEAKSLTDDIYEVGLDSLDVVMLSMYLGEMYGIAEEISRDMPIGTLEETFAFVEINKTTEPESIAAAIEGVQ